MRILLTTSTAIGLVFLLIMGNVAQIFERAPWLGYLFALMIGFLLIITGLNGYLEAKLSPWGDLNVKQVVTLYGWRAFFRGEE